MYVCYVPESNRDNKPYGSWSIVLGPQFRGSALTVGENLEKEFEEREQKVHKGRQVRHFEKKK